MPTNDHDHRQRHGHDMRRLRAAHRAGVQGRARCQARQGSVSSAKIRPSAPRCSRFFATKGSSAHADAESIRRVVEGKFIVQTNRGTVRGDRLLIATGRAPNTEELNLETIGIKTGPGGVIAVNDHLQRPETARISPSSCPSRRQAARAAKNMTGGEATPPPNTPGDHSDRSIRCARRGEPTETVPVSARSL